MAKSFENQIFEMNEEELGNLQTLVDERMGEIRLEKAKELMKSITIGTHIVYQKGSNEEEGLVDMITSDYVGIRGEEGKRNRRVSYEDILQVKTE